jgi:carbon-monoxide dehydrogenase large subunit
MDAKSDATTEYHEAPHVRVEDDPLVRGRGSYVADAPMPNQAYAYFVRSPHAFARIVSLDTSAAEQAPGVIGVLTAKDTAETGSIGRHPPVPGRGGKSLVLPHRPALAGERVVHVGEAVAMVVADTYAAAQDAGELVAVEYEELTPVTDAREALRDGAIGPGRPPIQRQTPAGSTRFLPQRNSSPGSPRSTSA